MRILLGVHQFFPTFYTGTERYVLNLTKQLQRMGHYVEVLTYAFNDQEGFRDESSVKVVTKRYSYEGVPVVAIRHKTPPDNFIFMFDLIDNDIYDAVKRIFREGDFDIYHCAHPSRIAAAIKAARDSGVRSVLMLTDYWLMCPLGIMLRPDNTLCDTPDDGRNCLRYCFAHVSRERIQKRISDARMLQESCGCLLSPSQFLIGLFDFTGSVPASRFVLARHGFDYEKKRFVLKKPSEKIIFAYIGTVQYHKGVHVLVEGFKNVRNQNIELQVWGGCFHEIEYQKSVMKMAGGDPRIIFKGSYNFNDMEKIMEGIDMVIVPSIWYENAPLTITTSFAYGIPVISSDIGGMSEAVKDGEDGLTFKVGDPVDLSAKIRFITDNPELIVKFKQNIQYPIRIEEEAFASEIIYKQLLSSE